MKIVQSFWSVPALGGVGSDQSLNRSKGGWLAARYHWLAWTFSCLQLRQFHDEVELVTDARGKQILIDQLQLPYTQVRVELDALDNANPHLWALGKLWAYRSQTAPFLHVDSDVFVWDALPTYLTDAPLAAQGIDSRDLWFYQATLETMIRGGFDLPPDLRQAHRLGGYRSLNAGIFGGGDIPFIQQYSQLAIDLALRNQHRLQAVDLPNVGAGMVNLVYEQLYAWCLAKQHQRAIAVLLPQYQSADSYDLITNFMNVYEKRTTYLHLAGRKPKQDLNRCLVLEKLVRHYYPDYYERVVDLVSPAAIHCPA